MQHIKSTVTSENWQEAMGWITEHYELEYMWPHSTRYNPIAISSGMFTAKFDVNEKVITFTFTDDFDPTLFLLRWA